MKKTYIYDKKSVTEPGINAVIQAFSSDWVKVPKCDLDTTMMTCSDLNLTAAAKGYVTQ